MSREDAFRRRLGDEGGIESHFVKLVDPSGPRALWIRHTALRERGDTEHSVWAIATIRDESGTPKIVAERERFRSSEVDTSHHTKLVTPAGTMEPPSLDGRVDEISWQLTLTPHSDASAPLPYAVMYRAPVPRSKVCSPMPHASASGRVRVGDEVWKVDEWPAMWGHNWGRSHSRSYHWTHCNAFEGAPDVWFEAATGNVDIGRVRSPKLTIATLSIDGKRYAFNRKRDLFRRPRATTDTKLGLALVGPGVEVEYLVRTAPDAMARLRYDTPEGDLLCSNTKLATARMFVRFDNGESRTLLSKHAALEITTPLQPGTQTHA